MRDPYPDGLFLHLRPLSPKPIAEPAPSPMIAQRLEVGSDHHTRDAGIDALITRLRRISLAEERLAEAINRM